MKHSTERLGIEELSSIYDRENENFLRDWMEFLSFKSISTDPINSEDCARCADWVVQHLQQIGFKAEIIPTSSKPLVFGEYRASSKDAKTVVFYGHYDVQPIDPIDLWKSPPFSPTVREGRLYARGAQDNKGQVMYFLKAVHSLIKEGKLNCNVKVVIEGEEECGSEGLSAVLDDIAPQIKSDVMIVCDTGTIQDDYSTVTMGLRGIVHCEIRLDGSNTDLHSGMFGGIVPNPATEIARLVASLHNPDGSIAVEGYYQGVEEPSSAELKLADSAPIDVSRLEASLGIKTCGGEIGRSLASRRGFRPTIEINGIHSGYGGPGSKTIIPAFAIAKISSRIVDGQDPERCLELIEKHLKKNAPPGLKFSLLSPHVSGKALKLSADSELAKKAKGVLEQVTPGKTVFMWEGASIPIVARFAEVSGAAPLLVGFGLDQDAIHAPNESFSIEQFRKGFLYSALILQELS